MNPIKIFIALFMLACVQKIYAGDTLQNKYPGAVLVQLRSEHNRIQAMKKAKDFAALEEVEHDALEVRKRMILDFTTYFSYCPVYYYMDTNADLVKNKKFDGILMNPDGDIVTKPVINSNSDDYFVVYYGYALSQSKSTDVVTDSSKYTYDPDPPNGKGLIVLNDKFQQINHFYKLGYDEGAFRARKKTLNEYYYSSKHYDIEYYPFAKLFQANLITDGFSRHRIKPDKTLLLDEK